MTVPASNAFGVDITRVRPGVKVRLLGGDPGTRSATVEQVDGSTATVQVHDLWGLPVGERFAIAADEVTGVGLVCEVDGPIEAPCWALDYIDFPTGWHLQRQGVIHTDRRCSAVQAWGGFLCDCGAIQAEWQRRREARQRRSQPIECKEC